MFKLKVADLPLLTKITQIPLLIVQHKEARKQLKTIGKIHKHYARNEERKKH